MRIQIVIDKSGWDDSDHPRDDSGRFASSGGGGSSSGGSEESPGVDESPKPRLVERIKNVLNRTTLPPGCSAFITNPGTILIRSEENMAINKTESIAKLKEARNTLAIELRKDIGDRRWTQSKIEPFGIRHMGVFHREGFAITVRIPDLSDDEKLWRA
jgi:hypothetical protein